MCLLCIMFQKTSTPIKYKFLFMTAVGQEPVNSYALSILSYFIIHK